MLYEFCVHILMVDDFKQMQLFREITGQFQANYEPYLLLKPALAHNETNMIESHTWITTTAFEV